MLLSVKDKKRDDDGHRKNANRDGKKHGKKHQGDEPVESSTPSPTPPAGQAGGCGSNSNVLWGDYCQ
jgi:hypothetical protein